MRVLPQRNTEISKTFHGYSYRPFSRAYAPELRRYGISRAQFLQFIDDLNDAWLAPAFWQTASKLGNILSMTPTVETQAIALGLQATAEYRAHKASKKATADFLSRANPELWERRGLHAQVLSTKEMMMRVGAPETMMKVSPLEHLNDQGQFESRGGGVSRNDPRVRRIEALRDYVMGLRFEKDQSPVNSLKSKGWMAKVSRRQEQVAAHEQNQKILKAREEGYQKLAEAEEAGRLVDEEIKQVEDEITQICEAANAKKRECGVMLDRSAQQVVARIESTMRKDVAKLEAKKAQLLKTRDREVLKKRKEGENSLNKSYKKEEEIANKVMWLVITKNDTHHVGEDDTQGLDVDWPAAGEYEETYRRGSSLSVSHYPGSKRPSVVDSDEFYRHEAFVPRPDPTNLPFPGYGYGF